MLNDLNLAYYLKKHKIKTIVNLHNPKGDWYKKEIKTAKIYGTKHITFVLTSDGYYDFDKVEKIVEILRTAEKPILIHCVGGADRTSLVSALYEYAINGKSKEESEKQLSWYYGHLPFINAKVKAMDRTFDNFVKINKQNQ
jgi:protein tyrosine/serine phosphatase